MPEERGERDNRHQLPADFAILRPKFLFGREGLESRLVFPFESVRDVECDTDTPSALCPQEILQGPRRAGSVGFDVGLENLDGHVLIVTGFCFFTPRFIIGVLVIIFGHGYKPAIKQPRERRSLGAPVKPLKVE